MTAPRRERGATTVEYALIVALVVVVGLGAITQLRENSENKLEQRELSSGGGVEISGKGFSYTGAGGVAGGGSDGGGGTTTVVDGVAFPSSGLKSSKQNQDFWIANVTVVLSSGGTDVENANVAVTWTYGTSTTTVACPLPSDKKGEVQCELASIPKAVASVTVEISTITGSSISYTTPTPAPSVSLTRPNGM